MSSSNITSSNASSTAAVKSLSISANVASSPPKKIATSNEFSTISPSKTLQNLIQQNPTICKIYNNLIQSSTLFLTSLYCLVISVNNSKVGDKMTVFGDVYHELFNNLAYVEESLDVTKDEFTLVLDMFNDLFLNFNFIILSQHSIKNNKLQTDISKFFKSRQVNMNDKNEFMREVLSAGLNDWYNCIKRTV
ncbi:hypothetical protein SBY92_000855 [Candida maltosa Xu316]|uniref:Uncharacterized protein n=1 Tax=Candida maltosa (strain Xu316) TaxID=1245528 RepID=M3K535_CANMX|nr:hypothetical protein G210_5276 [Candida maltosa Xu316]